MAKVKGKDTRPEKIVRSILHNMGYRFRLHRKDLPGNPDIVLPKYKKVIFVHGCFWHAHSGCPRSKKPSTNKDFWIVKIGKTVERDRRNHEKLKKLGWDVMVVWQCELKKSGIVALRDRLAKFLSS